jgi:hypothetical protein
MARTDTVRSVVNRSRAFFTSRRCCTDSTVDEKIDCRASFHDELGRTEENSYRFQKRADGLDVGCIHRQKIRQGFKMSVVPSLNLEVQRLRFRFTLGGRSSERGIPRPCVLKRHSEMLPPLRMHLDARRSQNPGPIYCSEISREIILSARRGTVGP